MRYASSLSIVIPAYNEAKRLPDSLLAILEYLRKGAFPAHEIIIVDDGSTDTTPRFLKDALAGSPVRVLGGSTNQGKGGALREGVLAARGEYILCTDADLSTPIEEVEKLLPRLMRDGYEVAIGSRKAGSITIPQPWYRRAIGRMGNWLIRAVLALPFKDTQCGFKLYRRETAVRLFRTLSLRRFSYDFEILSRAQSLGIPVAEVGVRWANSPESSVTARDVARSFIDVFRLRAQNLRATQGEALRFIAVGVVNTAVDFVAYVALTRVLLIMAGAPVTAKFFSFLFATISSFYLNRYWTFKILTPLTLSEVLRFYASVSVGLVVNIAAMYVFVHLFGVYDLAALLLSTIFTFATNFALAKFWVFNRRKESGDLVRQY